MAEKSKSKRSSNYEKLDPAIGQALLAVVTARGRIALFSIISGVLTLVFGALLVLGKAGQGPEALLLKIGNFELYAQGLGAVLLATSALWGLIAYLSRPTLKLGPAATKLTNRGKKRRRRLKNRSGLNDNVHRSRDLRVELIPSHV